MNCDKRGHYSSGLRIVAAVGLGRVPRSVCMLTALDRREGKWARNQPRWTIPQHQMPCLVLIPSLMTALGGVGCSRRNRQDDMSMVKGSTSIARGQSRLAAKDVGWLPFWELTDIPHITHHASSDAGRTSVGTRGAILLGLAIRTLEDGRAWEAGTQPGSSAIHPPTPPSSPEQR